MKKKATYHLCLFFLTSCATVIWALLSLAWTIHISVHKEWLWPAGETPMLSLRRRCWRHTLHRGFFDTSPVKWSEKNPHINLYSRNDKIFHYRMSFYRSKSKSIWIILLLCGFSNWKKQTFCFLQRMIKIW